MYKVNFSSEVFATVLSELRSKIKDRNEWRLSRVEEVEFATLEVWQDVVQTLEQNPFTYPEYSKGIYLAIELYLPFILAYIIRDNEVYVFEAILREQLYN